MEHVRHENLLPMKIYIYPLLLWFFFVAAMDFKFRKVKNLFLLIGFAYVLMLTFIFHKENYVSHFFGMVLIFFCFLGFYALGLMAAGDVKFSIPIGLFFGFSDDLYWIVVLATLMALMHSLLFLVIKNSSKFSLETDKVIKNDKFQNLKKIPYAGYLAIVAFIWIVEKLSLGSPVGLVL